MYRKTLIMAIATVLVSAAVWGQPVDYGHLKFGKGNDTYAARIHQLMFGSTLLNPRLSSMAGAYVAHSTGTDALTGNPAGLDMGGPIGIELFGGFSELSGENSMNGTLGFRDGDRLDPDGDADGGFYHGALGVVVPVGDAFTLGFGLQVFESDDEEDDLMDYDHERDAAFISISKRIADEVSIGYRLTFLDFDREGDSHGKVKPNNKELIDWLNRGNPGTVADFNTVIRFDSDTELDNTLDHTVGLLWCISEEWQLGLEFGYLRGDFEKTEKTILHGDPQPTINFDGDLERFRVRAGAAFDVTERTLLAVDVEYQDAEWDYDPYEKPLGTGTFCDAVEDRSDFSIHAGAEHELNDWFTLRGGLQYTWISYDNDFAERPYDLDVDYPGFFAGFGIFYRQIEIGYSLGYENEGDGDWNTSAGVTVKF